MIVLSIIRGCSFSFSLLLSVIRDVVEERRGFWISKPITWTLRLSQISLSLLSFTVFRSRTFPGSCNYLLFDLMPLFRCYPGESDFASCFNVTVKLNRINYCHWLMVTIYNKKNINDIIHFLNIFYFIFIFSLYKLHAKNISSVFEVRLRQLVLVPRWKWLHRVVVSRWRGDAWDVKSSKPYGFARGYRVVRDSSDVVRDGWNFTVRKTRMSLSSREASDGEAVSFQKSAPSQTPQTIIPTAVMRMKPCWRVRKMSTLAKVCRGKPSYFESVEHQSLQNLLELTIDLSFNLKPIYLFMVVYLIN